MSKNVSNSKNYVAKWSFEGGSRENMRPWVVFHVVEKATETSCYSAEETAIALARRASGQATTGILLRTMRLRVGGTVFPKPGKNFR